MSQKIELSIKWFNLGVREWRRKNFMNLSSPITYFEESLVTEHGYDDLG
jgi:hypothetical protein